MNITIVPINDVEYKEDLIVHSRMKFLKVYRNAIFKGSYTRRRLIKSMMIEVIVQNGQEAIQAEKLGADRIELVSAIQEGGLTPSYGTVKQVLGSVSIPVQVMIRPHSYHYCYTDGDLQIIREDIKKVLELGGTNIVFGTLNKNNTINERILENIIGVSPQLDITFHRAFDEVPSLNEAYETLNKYKENVKRILTSGGEESCVDGKKKLRDLVSTAKKKDGPKIMPGAGLTHDNIQDIHNTVNADQYHFGKAIRVDHSFANDFDENLFKFINNKLRG
ncbi:copper homeostasis protein CutC [Pseudalkalibacillus decolorationis]|uniref:copper homeostasis protein CutC n=1 Tax=Pseudalkalibacillus decolorationis TaxID=163879 RepID=UPI002147EB57|nr:copper homeostasis protein CutC [Pseudalkalibacillus decolorationis]